MTTYFKNSYELYLNNRSNNPNPTEQLFSEVYNFHSYFYIFKVVMENIHVMYCLVVQFESFKKNRALHNGTSFSFIPLYSESRTEKCSCYGAFTVLQPL